MKNTMKENNCTGIESKAGALSTKRIKRFLHLNTATADPINSAPWRVAGSASYREEENAAHEIQAELRKASARTSASTFPIR